ncbi:hypothetical protein ACA910_021880 [Epithemia clementina (nom. ined.)]
MRPEKDESKLVVPRRGQEWSAELTPSGPLWRLHSPSASERKKEIKRLKGQINSTSQTNGDGRVDRKVLEQVAGFLNHVARAYPTIQLYLNGVCATINAWRPDRDEEGWKTGDEKVEYDHLNAPPCVRLMKRMRFDVEALEELTSAEQPPERLFRPNKFGSRPTYVFGDASGSGYGTSNWTTWDDSIMVDFEACDPANEGKESFNYRELGNIVRRIEYLDQIGELTDAA